MAFVTGRDMFVLPASLAGLERFDKQVGLAHMLGPV